MKLKIRRRWIIIITTVALILIAFLVNFLYNISSTKSLVRGTVIDTQDSPLMDVFISISRSSLENPEELSVYSDSSGKYELRLPKGDFILSAGKDNYSVEEKPVKITSGRIQNVDFVLDNLPPPEDEFKLTRGPEITVEGQVDCMPYKNTEGTITMECAIGIRTMDGKYYTLGGENLYNQDRDFTQGAPFAGEYVKVTGFLHQANESKYAIEGGIEVITIEKANLENYANTNARTFYEGDVLIKPISRSVLKSRLESANCRYNLTGEITNNCLFYDSKNSKFFDYGFEIFPRGAGFGLVSFKIIDNHIFTQKDIPGIPDKEKYKNEVRKEIENLGIVVEIQEDTWNFTKIVYPWSVIY